LTVVCLAAVATVRLAVDRAGDLAGERRRLSRAKMIGCFPSPGLRRSVSNSVVAVMRSLSFRYP
jgi:hypothetical protein